MNLACVLLNNPVGNGKSKTCATPLAWSGHGLCGEERIVDAFQMFGCDARTGVRDGCFHMTICQSGHAKASAARHRLLGIQQEIEEYLLQFAGVAMNGRQVFCKISVNEDLRGFELMFEKR